MFDKTLMSFLPNRKRRRLTNWIFRSPSGHSPGRAMARRIRQVESYMRDKGMAGLASAWAMVKRRPNEYRLRMDAATRCYGVCPHTLPSAPQVRRLKTLHSERSLETGEIIKIMGDREVCVQRADQTGCREIPGFAFCPRLGPLLRVPAPIRFHTNFAMAYTNEPVLSTLLRYY